MLQRHPCRSQHDLITKEEAAGNHGAGDRQRQIQRVDLAGQSRGGRNGGGIGPRELRHGGGGAGIAAGVIGGALLGGLVGNLLDDRDKKMAAGSASRALETAPSGQSVAWVPPGRG
jgi:surface antigen